MEYYDANTHPMQIEYLKELTRMMDRGESEESIAGKLYAWAGQMSYGDFLACLTLLLDRVERVAMGEEASYHADTLHHRFKC